MRSPLISFRTPSGLMERLQERGESAPLVAGRDVARYYTLLEFELRTINLTEGEACLIMDALNGCLAAEPPELARILWAQVEDSLEDGLAEKWGVTGLTLVLKIKGWSFAQNMACIDAVERAWRSPKLNQIGTVDLLKEVGLLR